jgi:hypothetical protein
MWTRQHIGVLMKRNAMTMIKKFLNKAQESCEIQPRYDGHIHVVGNSYVDMLCNILSSGLQILEDCQGNKCLFEGTTYVGSLRNSQSVLDYVFVDLIGA